MSNREKFSQTFLILATTTTLIIMVVKSSLALSLGLVGALSIVRFRAAIKEPEELGFLFLIISIGLGFGANQIWTTITAISLICALYIIKQKMTKNENKQNLNLIINSDNPDKITISKITHILKKYCESVHLKRFDSSKQLFEASFIVAFNSFDKLTSVKKELENLSNSITIRYLDRE